jgi:hypothetical protein
MVTDTERSMKNFTPEDRARRRAQQIAEDRDRLRAQLETQERALAKITRIVLEECPARLAEIGLTVDEARDFVKGYPQ